MGLLGSLFKRRDDIYPFNIIKFGHRESIILFRDDKNNMDYSLDLEWVNGLLDIEFGVNGAENHDTTNIHNQYKILRTIHHIIKFIIKSGDIYIHTVTFKSSALRDGKIDPRSCDIRNRFFIRFVKNEYPNAIIYIRPDNVIEIKLNDG